MLTCKQVSSALAEGDYKDLPPFKRFFLKLHVKLCPFCGKFNTQLMESQDMVRKFREEEEKLTGERPTMDDTQKEKLKQLLAEQAEV